MPRHVHSFPLTLGAMTYYMPADAQFVGLAEECMFWLYDSLQMMEPRTFLAIYEREPIHQDTTLIPRGIYTSSCGDPVFVFEESYAQ